VHYGAYRSKIGQGGGSSRIRSLAFFLMCIARIIFDGSTIQKEEAKSTRGSI